MKTEKATETGLAAKPNTVPYNFEKIKIKLIKTVTIMCPANMFAKRRTIKTNGFVINPESSTMGISGMGNFSHQGTSGL